MPRMIKIMVRREGELTPLWVPVKLTKLSDGTTKFETLSENKLGSKKWQGLSHKKYQEWGQQGGRPTKWKSEAERKRYARLQKALAEGRELRSYKYKNKSNNNFSTGTEDFSRQEKIQLEKKLKEELENEETKDEEDEEEDEEE